MISIIIPTFNPPAYFRDVLKILREQTLAEIIIIDSSSKKDLIEEIISQFNIEKFIKIKPQEFNHGSTRNLGISMAKGDILIYLTQDALPVDNTSIERLIRPILNDNSVGAAYGRQLPAKNANPVAAHARLFNYPPVSCVKCITETSRSGIKTAFISNSFAAYRKSALLDVGGFPQDIIISEDMYVGAKMLLKGWKIAYCADAMVYHSHNYTLRQEFKRYFDIGVFHNRERWILKTFGKAKREGLRFVRSEFKYLWREDPCLIPSAIVRNFMKFAAYKLGSMERYIPRWLKYRLSMNKNFWIRKSL